jgi:hypothetical protein
VVVVAQRDPLWFPDDFPPVHDLVTRRRCYRRR